MKRLAISIIILITSQSCRTRDPDLIGTWFEITDSNRAGIMIFDADSVRFPYGLNSGYNEWYSVRGNKITFQFGRAQNYSVENDTITFIPIDSEDEIYKYHKREPFSINDFIDYRYGVELSEIQNIPIKRWGHYDNIMVLKLTPDSLVDLKINGIPHTLCRLPQD